MNGLDDELTELGEEFGVERSFWLLDVNALNNNYMDIFSTHAHTFTQLSNDLLMVLNFVFMFFSLSCFIILINY